MYKDESSTFIIHFRASHVINGRHKSDSSLSTSYSLCLAFVSADAFAVSLSAFGASSLGMYSSTNCNSSSAIYSRRGI